MLWKLITKQELVWGGETEAAAPAEGWYLEQKQCGERHEDGTLFWMNN